MGQAKSELLTAAQMRSIEQAAIDSGAVTGLELMERAGQSVVDAIMGAWPELAPSSKGAGGAAPRPADSPRDISEQMKAVVLCGPGNNGGDGFVVARLLKARGWDVEVYFYGNPSKLPPDARTNYARWRDMGTVRAWDDEAVDTVVRDPATNIVVDAVFGTGLSRSTADALHETHEGFIERVFVHNEPTVAVDIPSGICADTGRDFGRALCAQLTVTFHRKKLGHTLGGAPEHCGKIITVDIGLPNFICSKISPPEA